MKPKLLLYNQFQEVLKNYHVSEHAAEALKNLKLILLIAPTSTGKNTIIRHLSADGTFHYVISDTTRPPRVNDGMLEQNGKDYWFRAEEEMIADLKAGEFLEAELIHDQQVSGISMRELQKAKEKGRIAITDVDLEGIRNVMKVKPDTVAIMLLPPNFEEWQNRMTRRGVMSPEELANRMKTALRMFNDALENKYYKFVIAENVEQTGQIISSLANGGPNPHQDRGEDLVNRLRTELQQYIESNHT